MTTHSTTRVGVATLLASSLVLAAGSASLAQTATDEPAERPLRILLVNDDGYEAEGLLMLFEGLTDAGYEVTSVTPLEATSGLGTAIRKDDRPRHLRDLGGGQYAFEGTPTDALKVALNVVMPEPPDLVISGINHGGNYGEAQMNSGTVGAAARAIRHGYPAIAANVAWPDDDLTLAMPPVVDFVVSVVDQLQAEQVAGEPLMPLGTGLSINYPGNVAPPDEIAGVVFVPNEPIYTDTINYRWDPESRSIRSFTDEAAWREALESTTPSDLTEVYKGYVTINVIDGSWNAPEAAVDHMQGLLGDLEP